MPVLSLTKCGKRSYFLESEDKLIFTVNIITVILRMAKVFKNSHGGFFLESTHCLYRNQAKRKHYSICLTRLVLTLNRFSFAESSYKQINGIAIGTKMGTSYDRLHRTPILQSVQRLNSTVATFTSHDCHIVAPSSSREELDQFSTPVNSFHPAIK